MQTRHILIMLLVAAHVLVGLAVVAGARLPGRFGESIVFAVVSAGQVGLLSIWTALGRRAAPWRPVVLILMIVAWSWFETSKTSANPHWLLVFLPTATVTVAVLYTARAFGLRLFLPEVDSTEKEGPWQFSLSRLFAWTTSTAICLGLMCFVFRHFNISSDTHWPTVIILSICLASIILISPWLAWMRLSRRTTLALALIIALLLVILRIFFPPTPLEETIIAAYCCLELLFMVGSLVVLRVAGYRLEFYKKIKTNSG